MAHSYISCFVHYIFSTKNRQKIIKPDLEKHLFPYMGGIARENKMKALAIGGTENHVHLLLTLPSILSIAKAIQLIKDRELLSTASFHSDSYSEYDNLFESY